MIISGINYALYEKSQTAEVYNQDYSGNISIPSVVVYNGIQYSVTDIGWDPFCGHEGLTSITIPGSVTSIAKSAFRRCKALTSIVVDSENKVYDSRNNCNAIIETATNTLIVGCRKTIIPNCVTSIGDGAFYGCTGLTSITIPNSVTSIGESAFYGCTGLTSVTIPNSVTSIGDMAFAGCTGIDSIVVESGNKVYDSRNNCNAIIETATNTLIVGCRKTIIPNSVTSIGVSAFYGCTGLTSVTIPNSVMSIKRWAFRDCLNLECIVIPNSVTSVGGDAFGFTAWYNNQPSKGIMYINNVLYANRGGDTNIVIKEGTTSISDWAFWGCYFTSIYIPDSVTSIGTAAFDACWGLTTITLPKSISEIGRLIFDECDNLQTICVPQGMTDAFCKMGLEPWRDIIVECV